MSSGAIRCRISPSFVRAVRFRRRSSSVTPPSCGWVNSSWPSATRSGWQARSPPASCRDWAAPCRPGRPRYRRSHPDRRRAEPGQQRRRPCRQPRRNDWRQHSRRRRGRGASRPDQRTTRRLIATLISQGRIRRAWLGIAGSQISLPAPVADKIGRPQRHADRRRRLGQPGRHGRPSARRHRHPCRRHTGVHGDRHPTAHGRRCHRPATGDHGLAQRRPG